MRQDISPALHYSRARDPHRYIPAVSYNPGTDSFTPLWSRTPHTPHTAMYTKKLDRGMAIKKGGE